MIKKYLYAILLLTSILSNLSYCFSQNDSVRKIYIDYNILQGFVDEKRFCAEYRPVFRHSFFFSAGWVTPKGTLMFKSLSRSQDEFPFFVYNGVSTRIGHHLFFHRRKSGDTYWSNCILYKYLHYENVKFVDSKSEPYIVDYSRSEFTNVLGANTSINVRRNLIDLESFSFYVNFSFGIEYRYKHRVITTHTTDWPTWIPVGHFIRNQDVFLPVFGLNMGVGFK